MVRLKSNCPRDLSDAVYSISEPTRRRPIVVIKPTVAPLAAVPVTGTSTCSRAPTEVSGLIEEKRVARHRRVDWIRISGAAEGSARKWNYPDNWDIHHLDLICLFSLRPLDVEMFDQLGGAN